jgi:P4 family phage/plasmid primase-like protien
VGTTWLRVLGELMEGDAELVDFVHEVMGCCLDPLVPFKYFVLLHGPGVNGKSVVLNVLRALLGDENVSAEPLNRLRTDKFATFNLLGKFANLSPDESYFESDDESVIRGLTGGDAVKFEEKYKSALVAPNTAKLLASCNNLPTLSDRSDATWNRLKIIPFKYRVPRARQDPRMQSAGFWAAELPGILNEALAGLARYRRRGCRLPALPKVDLLVEQHRLDSQPALRFLLEHYEYSPQGMEFSGEIYEAYKAWLAAEEPRRGALSGPKFGTYVRQAFPDAGNDDAPRGAKVGKAWYGIWRMPGV